MKLKILKINKKIQERLNISIDDYKECSELYSSIEIKIKPAENKYGEFINIPDKDKEYYHIYFDNSNEEIKRNYLEENEKVKKIKIKIDYQVTSFKELFCLPAYGNIAKKIKFKKFYRNNITDMCFMFSTCLYLEKINFKKINTSNVTNMSGMFSECYELKKIKGLSKFNTNKVTDMSYMFYRCTSLKKINVSNFDTSNVTDMSNMFGWTKKLKKIDLSNFNTNKVTDMSCMFQDSNYFPPKDIKQNQLKGAENCNFEFFAW